MYIKNGICYAGELTDDIKVVNVNVLPGRMLLVTFNTGEQRLFDTTLLNFNSFTFSAKRIFKSD